MLVGRSLSDEMKGCWRADLLLLLLLMVKERERRMGREVGDIDLHWDEPDDNMSRRRRASLLRDKLLTS